MRQITSHQRGPGGEDSGHAAAGTEEREEIVLLWEQIGVALTFLWGQIAVALTSSCGSE